jgi:hypothetical protein
MCRCQFIRAKKQSDRNWFTWNNIHMLVWDCFEKHKNKDMSQLKDQKVINIYENLKGGKRLFKNSGRYLLEKGRNIGQKTFN